MTTDDNSKPKPRLHPRNRNRAPYNLTELVKATPELSRYLKSKKNGESTVDFSNVTATKVLNQSLLRHYYGIEYWDFPEQNLCPPIPGRADYIHHMADLLAMEHEGKIPLGDGIKCLDIGVGASCIYPIIGTIEYGWQFIGTDVDEQSLESARNIIDKNDFLKGKIACRLQEDSTRIFDGVLNRNELIDLCICNPPFHASLEEAEKSTKRKIKNLTGKKNQTAHTKVAGVESELIYPDGERGFIQSMVNQSVDYAQQCYLFSTLVSKESNLKAFYGALKDTKAKNVKTISMNTGNKNTRVVTWTYLTPRARKEWRNLRWRR